jgi:hypothetical protein
MKSFASVTWNAGLSQSNNSGSSGKVESTIQMGASLDVQAHIAKKVAPSLSLLHPPHRSGLSGKATYNRSES